jgi:hypothetical protein
MNIVYSFFAYLRVVYISLSLGSTRAALTISITLQHNISTMIKGYNCWLMGVCVCREVVVPWRDTTICSSSESYALDKSLSTPLCCSSYLFAATLVVPELRQNPPSLRWRHETSPSRGNLVEETTLV